MTCAEKCFDWLQKLRRQSAPVFGRARINFLGKQKMKKKSILAILIAVLCFSAVCFTACSSYDGQTPQEILENVYGDTEYTISFVAEDADAPVADMTYTAKSMPALPTPTRVGYVFSGWYFDSAYTKP